MKVLKSFVFLGSLIILLAACGDDKKTITIPGGENGEDIEIDLNLDEENPGVSISGEGGEEEGSFAIDGDSESGNSSIEISSGDGNSTSIQSGQNLTIPEEIPSDFPMADDAQIINVTRMTGDNGNTIVAFQYETAADVEILTELYKARIDSSGMPILSESTMAGMYNIMPDGSADYEGELFSLGIMDEEDYRHVRIQYYVDYSSAK